MNGRASAQLQAIPSGAHDAQHQNAVFVQAREGGRNDHRLRQCKAATTTAGDRSRRAAGAVEGASHCTVVAPGCCHKSSARRSWLSRCEELVASAAVQPARCSPRGDLIRLCPVVAQAIELALRTSRWQSQRCALNARCWWQCSCLGSRTWPEVTLAPSPPHSRAHVAPPDRAATPHATGQCIIAGVNKPENGQRPDTCLNGNVIPDGAKCALTCDEGFKLQGQQPSCTLTTFRVGNIMCNDDDFPWYLEVLGGSAALILIFWLCKGLGILPYASDTWAPPVSKATVRPGPGP